VLEVGRRRSDAADERRREGARRPGHSSEQEDAGADLEAARGDVPVRDPVAERVEEQAEDECPPPRPGEGARRGAAPHVHRDDHIGIVAYRGAFWTGIDEGARQALERDRTIDITTTGRKSGLERRLEIWFFRAGGKIYLSGSPGRRDWVANIRAHPEFTFHLKQSAHADLRARGHPVDDPDERRRVMASIVEGLGRPSALDEWVARSPLVEVEFLA
jgi:deazaflavin-dependent oxidoreductase (nitroreductase family)